jgi:hypothetical protein
MILLMESLVLAHKENSSCTYDMSFVLTKYCFQCDNAVLPCKLFSSLLMLSSQFAFMCMNCSLLVSDTNAHHDTSLLPYVLRSSFLDDFR